MSVVFFALGLWLVASVPIGLLLGWACGLNKLSRDAEVPLGEAVAARSRTMLEADRGTRALPAA